MPQLSPDQLDDCLGRALIEVRYREDEDSLLDPRLALLHQINEELKKDGGEAGTHAYEMLAAAEEINAGNTAVLIELIAAVTMWKTETRRNPDTMTVEFTPHDIDVMQRGYQIHAKRDGMLLSVTLIRREEAAESRLKDDETPDGAKPQAMPSDAPEPPLWGVRTVFGVWEQKCSREEAEEAIRDEYANDPVATLEGRYCPYDYCPSTRRSCDLKSCAAKEATSPS